MFQAIIFDCDGTLVDSEYTHYLAWKEAALMYGFVINKEQWPLFTGKCDELIADNFIKENKAIDKQALLAAKFHCFEKLQAQGMLPIVPTIQFVNQLAREKEKLGLKLGVASAARKVEIMSYLQNLKIRPFFDVVISGYDDLHEYDDPEGKNKPKPYVYLQAAKLLQVHPINCLAIEDSYTGVMSAVNAGCQVIAIPNQFTMNHDFSQANFVVESLAKYTFSDLLMHLKNKRQR